MNFQLTITYKNIKSAKTCVKFIFLKLATVFADFFAFMRIKIKNTVWCCRGHPLANLKVVGSMPRPLPYNVFIS